MEVDRAIQNMFDNLIAATIEKDFAKFSRDGTSIFKGFCNKMMFKIGCIQLSPLLSKNHEVMFLTELKEKDLMAYLWKISFKSQSDDFLARLTIKDGKVASFFIKN